MNFREVIGVSVVFLVSAFPVFGATAEIAVNFTGATFGVDSDALPADTDGAIGPNHYVEFVNGHFSVFDKNTGNRVLSLTDIGFWTGAGVTFGRSISVTDPRVAYDASSGRWFASMVDLNTRRQTANHFLLAVSSSADPTQSWHAVTFAAAGGLNYFADFPTLGFDTNAVYLSGDLFDALGNPAGPVIVSIPKASLLARTPTTTGMQSSGLLSYTQYGDVVQPAMTDVAGGTAEVLLAAGDLGEDFLPHSTLVLTTMHASDGTVSLGSNVVINVPAYEIPINPTQPGGIGTLDDGDARFGAAVRRVGDVLYATHAIEVNNRAAVRWYRIDAVTHTLIEAGTISDPELEYFYPSIAANTNGVVVIGCNGTSTNTYISSFAFIGQVTNNTLTFGARMLLKEGLASYDTHLSDGISRWGDYSATTVDPSDSNRFWTIQAFPSDATTWATQVTELIVSTGGGTTTNTVPSLTLEREGGSLRITWPTTAGAVLQFTPTLSPPDWQDVASGPVISNGQSSEVIVPDGREGFYRLIGR